MKLLQLLSPAIVEADAPRTSTTRALSAIVVAIASTAVLALGGCAGSAGIAPAARTLSPARVGMAAEAGAAPKGTADWWRSFGDPTLDSLINRALADSPNLKLVQARLARAGAGVAASQAGNGPLVTGGAEVTRERFSANTIYPPPLGGHIYSLGNAQIAGSWEFDFFGRNRAAIEAAVGTQRAAQAEVQAARMLLSSSVARTYVQLGRLLEQRDVARGALKQREATLRLVNQRVLAGLDTAVEQRQGEGALPEARLLIEQLEEQIALTRHSLAALTAQPMDALDGLLVPLHAVQVVAVPVAVPADLLGRRADITAARWRIEAARSDTAAAHAQFYPNVNLMAFAGLSSLGLDRLFHSTSEQWGASPAIHLPIFDSGRLRANLRIKTADLDAAIESYNGAVFDAVRDAADQVSSLQSVTRQQVEQVSALGSAESAYDLATQRYTAGLGTYLTVLNAEATVLNQRRLSADLKARALDAQIGLIRALGGAITADTDLATRATANAQQVAPKNIE